MIVIQARVPVRNDRRSLALQHIDAFVRRTRAEAGCLLCEAFVNLEDPDLVFIHQQWEDAEQLESHAAGANLDQLLEVLPEFVAGDVSTSRYETVPAAGMAVGDGDEDVDAAPRGVTLH